MAAHDDEVRAFTFRGGENFLADISKSDLCRHALSWDSRVEQLLSPAVFLLIEHVVDFRLSERLALGYFRHRQDVAEHR